MDGWIHVILVYVPYLKDAKRKDCWKSVNVEADTLRGVRPVRSLIKTPALFNFFFLAYKLSASLNFTIIYYINLIPYYAKCNKKYTIRYCEQQKQITYCNYQ
jgi:hypothetical protein